MVSEVKEVPWGRVAWRHARVAILGQGPSFADVPLDELGGAQSEGVALIAVNGAIESVPFADYFFTLDHSVENRARIADPIPGVEYVQAVPDDYAALGNRVWEHVTYLRRIVEEEPDPRSAPFRERVRKQVVGGLSERDDRIFTGNSGFGALGLAYLMAARRVGLFGIDGRGKRRWDGTRNRYLGHMGELFAGAAEQLRENLCDVRTASPESAVDAFPRWTPERTIEWLRR